MKILFFNFYPICLFDSLSLEELETFKKLVSREIRYNRKYGSNAPTKVKKQKTVLFKDDFTFKDELLIKREIIDFSFDSMDSSTQSMEKDDKWLDFDFSRTSTSEIVSYASVHDMNYSDVNQFLEKKLLITILNMVFYRLFIMVVGSFVTLVIFKEYSCLCW